MRTSIPTVLNELRALLEDDAAVQLLVPKMRELIKKADPDLGRLWVDLVSELQKTDRFSQADLRKIVTVLKSEGYKFEKSKAFAGKETVIPPGTPDKKGTSADHEDTVAATKAIAAYDKAMSGTLDALKGSQEQSKFDKDRRVRLKNLVQTLKDTVTAADDELSKI